MHCQNHVIMTIEFMPSKREMDQQVLIQKVKDLRLERGYSLADMARRTGLSRGYLSKIENGKNLPPVFTLNKIAYGLGVDLTYLLATEETNISSQIVITHKADRDHFITELKDTQNRVAPLAAGFPGKNMDPYIFEVPKNDYQVYQHEGEEFYLILEGRVEIDYGGKRYMLETGDSIYIDTSVPHSGRSISEEPAVALMMIYHYKKTQHQPLQQGMLPNNKTHRAKKGQTEESKWEVGAGLQGINRIGLQKES